MPYSLTYAEDWNTSEHTHCHCQYICLSFLGTWNKLPERNFHLFRHWYLKEISHMMSLQGALKEMIMYSYSKYSWEFYMTHSQYMVLLISSVLKLYSWFHSNHPLPWDWPLRGRELEKRSSIYPTFFWVPTLSSPGGSDDKESVCNKRKLGFNPWVRKVPWRSDWQPTLVFLSAKSHEQRSLAGYSPWGHKESNMTEQLTYYVPSTQL